MQLAAVAWRSHTRGCRWPSLQGGTSKKLHQTRVYLIAVKYRDITVEILSENLDNTDLFLSGNLDNTDLFFSENLDNTDLFLSENLNNTDLFKYFQARI